MIDAATPADKDGTPPVSPAATPANEGDKKPEEQGQNQGNATPDSVTLTKEEHDKLVADAADVSKAKARQGASDRKAERLESLLSRKGSHFKSNSSDKKPSEEEIAEAKDEQALEEDRKATQGIMGLALDPIYRAVFDADPTLRNLVTSNPLGVLPLLAPDAVDAEDAIQLVKDALQTRADVIKEDAEKNDKGKEGEEKPTGQTGETPPQTGANIGGAQQEEADVEAAKKNPNTEGAIANMVKLGIKKLGKQ